MAHAKDRLRERFDLLAADETLEELTRAALKGTPVVHLNNLAKGSIRRIRWFQVHFRGRDMIVCVDDDTEMVRTVL